MASLSTCHLGLWLGWQILLNLVKPPFLISRIHNYCNLTSVEQLKCVKFWCMFIRTDSLTFLHGPIFFQVYCTLIVSNMVIVLSCSPAAKTGSGVTSV